jgi:hypothetical protein
MLEQFQPVLKVIELVIRGADENSSSMPETLYFVEDVLNTVVFDEVAEVLGVLLHEVGISGVDQLVVRAVEADTA